MQQRQRFITPDGIPQKRWLEAFGNLDMATSSLGLEGAVAGMLVWISTRLPEWEEDVRRMAGAGARVVVLSPTPDNRQASRAFAVGARGYAHALSTPDLLRRIAAVAPERRSDLAQLGLRAMFGGAIASWLTATVAGMLL